VPEGDGVGDDAAVIPLPASWVTVVLVGLGLIAAGTAFLIGA
jgi:hypothetical protein